MEYTDTMNAIKSGRTIDMYIYINTYMSVSLIIIDSNNELSNVQCQAIIWTYDHSFLIRPLGIISIVILFKMKKIIQENIMPKLVVILSWPQCVTQFRFNTLRPRQMAAVSQTTLSTTFSWMKILEFRLRLHWSLFPRVKLTIFRHWFR